MLLLFRGLTRVLEVDRPSSLPFLKFLLRSRILLNVPFGLSGGKLVARLVFPVTRKLVFEELKGLVF